MGTIAVEEKSFDGIEEVCEIMRRQRLGIHHGLIVKRREEE